MRPEGRGDFERLLQRRPALAPVGLMASDARRHFLVSRRRGRQIEPLGTMGLGKPLRIGAFSRARAAEHEQAADDRRGSFARAISLRTTPICVASPAGPFPGRSVLLSGKPFGFTPGRQTRKRSFGIHQTSSG